MDINLIKDVVIPIAIGVLSSVLFLLLASRVRPRIVISDHIAKMPPDGCVRSLEGYAIKVVNHSRRSATEVHARLALVRKLTVAGGQINQTDEFLLVKDTLFELPGKSRDPENSAFRFITYQDIESQWTATTYMLFTISAKDALTGFGRVYSKEYYLPRDALRAGTFAVGHSMEIK